MGIQAENVDSKVLDLGHSRVSLESDGIVRVELRPWVKIDLVEAREILEARMKLAPHPALFLVVATDPVTVTREGREFFNQPHIVSLTLGMALLVNSSVVATLANVFGTLMSPKFPTQIFHNEPSARTWLFEIQKQGPASSSEMTTPMDVQSGEEAHFQRWLAELDHQHFMGLLKSPLVPSYLLIGVYWYFNCTSLVLAQSLSALVLTVLVVASKRWVSVVRALFGPLGFASCLSTLLLTGGPASPLWPWIFIGIVEMVILSVKLEPIKIASRLLGLALPTIVIGWWFADLVPKAWQSTLPSWVEPVLWILTAGGIAGILYSFNQTRGHLENYLRTIHQKRKVNSQKLVDTLTRLAGMDFTARMPAVSNEDPFYDTNVAVNTLADEFQRNLLGRHYAYSILDSMADPLIILDSQFRIRRANHASQELLGCSIAALKGRDMGSFIQLGQAGRERGFRLETNLRDREQKNIPVLVSVTRLPHAEEGEGHDSVCLIIDLRQKKKEEAELREKEIKMFTSSKLSTLGQLAGGVAHEINNPLAVIVGKSQQIQRALQTDPTKVTPEMIRDFTEKIHSTAWRISKIVKGLRSFSRDGELDPVSPVPLSQIINAVLDISAEKFKAHGVRLAISEIPDVLVECREVQLAQVLMNLVVNAFDAIENIEDKWVEVNCVAQPDGHVELSVRDAGAGISPAVVERLMTPFFTTKPPGRGTGLGLSVSSQIMASHRGTLTYELRGGHTTFVMRMPAQQLPVR